MRPLTTLLAATATVLALTVPPAQAASVLPVTSAGPTGRLAVSPMGDVTFTARIGTAVQNPFIRISDRPPGPDGSLSSVVASGAMTPTLADGGFSWRLPPVSALRRQPGTYWWQVVGSARDQRGIPELQAGPAQRLDIYVPAAWSRRGPIDRRFGRHGRTRFLLSTAGIPAGIDRARLRNLVALSARRWGLHLTGWTSRPAGVRDRVNVAGFAPVPTPGALAVQEDWMADRYRTSQRCIGNVCGPVQRRFVGRVRTDQDLVIRPDVPWGLGPARPSDEEYDLESVLVHELGHMAGNKKHASRCTNSPMAGSLAKGEWWRTPHDWYRRGCAPQQPGGLF